MTDIAQLDRGAKEYFDTLPPLIQEQIRQNGTALTSRDDLQAFYTNILRSGPDTVKPGAYM